jgi:glutaredoxin
MSRRVTLYGRPGCHLCTEAEQRIRQLEPEAEIELVDIELDDELHSIYLERIPVVVIDGEQLAELVQYRRPSFERLLRERLSG